MAHIRAVVPLKGYRLLIEFDTGSNITIDLSSKLKTVRFIKLADKAIFDNVQVQQEEVIWGGGILKIHLFELIDIAMGLL